MVLFVAAFVLFSAEDSYAQTKGKNLKNYQNMVAAYNKGDKEQALSIALAYKNGSDGAARDGGLAIEWLDKAFDAGIVRAATIAGTMYYKGDGVMRDFSKAEKYYRKAAAKGNEDAMLRLGYMYQHGYGFEKSLASAKKMVWACRKKI